MLFNSLEFAVFLPVVFLAYWFFVNRNLRAQNLILLVASYIFYGWWDWRFLSLIIISSTADYIIGIQLSKIDKTRARKYLLIVSVFINIGLLGFFKYYNFFIESFSEAFTFFGTSFRADRLNIVLPVGISFYTFQTLSYTIDVYRKRIEAEKDWVVFYAYVSFFPQLVAGPIERASNLLPQFTNKRHFSYDRGVEGMRQILWGLFKKVVIADNCAVIVNQVFANPNEYLGYELLLAAILFAFQIYCDFSGYSDIAIGTGKLFGFNLMKNFALPYFSRDIAEFWRRWHISLSTWFRDYLYIPLGGSRGTILKVIRNILIIFIVSGFWHGANWTFIFWGFLNAIYFIPLILSSRNRQHLDIVAKGRMLPNVKEFFQIGTTFLLTLFAWIFFRSETISGAFEYIKIMLIDNLIIHPGQILFLIRDVVFIPVCWFIAFLLIIEWTHREKEFAFQVAEYRPVVRRVLYSIVFGFIFFAGSIEEAEFIYFQF